MQQRMGRYFGAGWLLLVGVWLNPTWAALPASGVGASAKIERDSDRSLMREQRSRGLQSSGDYAAARIDRQTDRPLGLELDLRWNDAAVFFERGSSVVVDQAVFGSLSRVDVTDTPKQWVRIGDTSIRGEARLDAVALLLIKADVILTWAHIGSELVLTPLPSLSEGLLRAWRLKGSHTYYTNEENHSAIDVVLAITASGEIRVGPPSIMGL